MTAHDGPIPPLAPTRWERPVDLYQSLTESYRQGQGPLLRVIDETGAFLEFGVDELDERSRAVAGALVALGVGKGTPVGIVLRPGVEWLATFLGCVRLGAIAVPLHHGFNGETIGFRLSDIGVSIVCTSSDSAETLSHEPFVLLLVEDEEKVPNALEGTSHLHRVSEYRGYALDVSVTLEPNDPVVAVFTSGTSGEPKVTLWSSVSFAAFETFHRLGLGLTSVTRYLTLTNPTWSFGLANGVLGSLLVGTTLHLLTGSLSTQVLMSVIDSLGIELLSLTPMHLRRIVRDLDGIPSPMRSLEALYCAGERLNTNLAEEASALLDCTCFDGYGLTEIGMPICDRRMVGDLEGTPARVLPGFEVSILDPHHRPLPPGETGEIGIHTDTSLFWFDGYFHDQERTRANFSADGKYFLTGDLGMQEPNGSVRCLGRLDEFIVLPELRVHPVEFEAAVHRVTKAHEVGVVGVPSTRGSYDVVAFFGGHDPSMPSISQEELANRLVAAGFGHLVPNVVRFLDRLPRTASGKLQRTRLAALYRAEDTPR